MATRRQNLAAVGVLGAGVVLIALIIATGPEVEPIPQAAVPPEVQTLIAAKEDVRMTVVAHGEVLPRTESNLVAEVAGRVVAVSPALVSGGFFQRGDVLVRIEAIDYQAALEKARAHLISVESEVANAEKAHERLLELAERESVSESALDDAETRLAIAQASLRQASVEVERAERDLERTRLVAPYAGRVRSERIDVGQFVNRGESVATLYATDFAEVRLPVQDDDLAFLPLSLGREASADAMPEAVLTARFAGAERTWPARIVRAEGELDPQSRMVHLIAQVEAPYDQVAAKPPLTVGLFVNAEIQGRRLEGILALPRASLRDGDQLHVVGADHRLEFRDVEVVRVTDEMAYIGDGVRDGELISLSALASPVEGQQVVPVPRAAAPPQ